MTFGRMLTSTSIRSPTVLAFCSKLQLSFPLSVRCLASCGCLKNTFDRFISSFLPQRGRAANSQCAGGEGMKILRRASVSIYCSCWETPELLSLPSQQKQQELKRVEKWLKMVKNWDKYRNSEKVCEAFHPLTTSVLASVPPFLVSVFQCYFLFLLFSILLLSATLSQQKPDCMIKLQFIL